MNKYFEKLSKKAILWIGSPMSIVIHTIFFTALLSLAFASTDFIKIMLIFNTIVSLEAIYLSIFIQIAVNAQSKDIEEIQEDIEDINKEDEEKT